MDSSFTVTNAVAIKDGSIVEAGDYQSLKNKYKATQSIDLEGKIVYPGFMDAHCHFSGYAMDLYKCELQGTQSWDEILQQIKEYAKNHPDGWIYGRGWDQNDWSVKEFPDRNSLDSLFPERPVFLKRVDGHAVVCNTKALTLAGINEKTVIEGGEVEVKNGRMTGILLDNAFNAVEKIIPHLSEKQAIIYFEQMADSCYKYGLTSVMDCGVEDHVIQWLDDYLKRTSKPMRITALLSDTSSNYTKYLKSGPYRTDWLHVSGFKMYSDGALGSRGACLLEEYSDRHGHFGFLLRSKTYMDSICRVLSKTRFQLCTHAIGDSANRVILTSYGKVLGSSHDRRWRIEHAQVVHPSDFELFGKYKIVPSVQPTHATSDMYWAEERLGKQRMKGAYAYKTLLGQLGWLPLGTDFPVEAINPLFTFHAAVARQDAQNYPVGGFQKEEALSRKEALYGMTLWAAKGCFEENEKGSLEKGKFADLTILDKDLMTIPLEQIRSVRVEQVWIGGKRMR